MTDTLQVKIYFNLNSVWTDSTSDVLSGSKLNAVWGMRNNKPLSLLADVGQLTFSLNNETGKYTPGGVSALSGWKKGVAVKVVFTFLEQTYVRFYGKIDSIRIDAGSLGNRRAHVTVLDWMDYATKYPLNNPAIQTNKRADEAMTTILDGMPIQPQARNFDTGVNTFPLIFKDATLKTRAYTEFQRIALSEMAYLYHVKDKDYGDTIRLESNTSRPTNTQIKQVTQITTPGFLLKEDGSYLLKEDSGKLITESYTTNDVSINNTMTSMDVEYGTNLINRVSTTVNPTKISTSPTLLYELDSSIFIDANSSITFNIQFTEESSKRLVAALPPDDTTYPQVLLHFDGQKDGRLIVDESGHLWDALDCSIVTNIKNLGSGSAYLDSTQSYIYSQGSSDDYELGSGDFTIEWFEYRFDATSGDASIARSGAGGFVPFILGQSDGTNSLIYMTSNGSSWDIANGKTFGAISANTWVHYAITRSGTTFRAFKNGTQTDTWTSSSAILASTADMVIGKNGSNYISACFDEFRLTKGLSRYDGSFTTPTTQFMLSGVVYAGWTDDNGTGTELTGSFTVDVVYGAAGAEVTVDNTSTLAGYLSTFKVYSYIVESVNSITDIRENTASIDEYGYSELSINQSYQQDLTRGIVEAEKILESDREPTLVLNKVTMNANRDNQMMLSFLNVDVGDLVEVIEDQTGISSSFFVQGVEYSASAGASGAVVDFSWIVKKFLDTRPQIGLNFSGYSVSRRVQFGLLPLLTNTIYRVWSWWGDGTTGTVISTDADYLGEYLGFETIAGVPGKLLLATRRFPNSGYFYTTTSAPAGDNHYVVAYDASSASNVPTMYINGVSYALNTSDMPAGTYVPDTSCNLYIGAKKNYYYPAPIVSQYLGELKDIRCYDGDQISSLSTLVASLYAAGAGGAGNTDGMVFNTFGVNNSEQSSYIGASLTEDMKVIDLVSKSVGTPYDAPIGIAI